MTVINTFLSGNDEAHRARLAAIQRRCILLLRAAGERS